MFDQHAAQGAVPVDDHVLGCGDQAVLDAARDAARAAAREARYEAERLEGEAAEDMPAARD